VFRRFIRPRCQQRIERAEKFATTLPDYTKPTGVPKDDEQHLRLMYDLMALALQTDTTRIATFMGAHDGSDRRYPHLGVSEGHHTISHHEKNTARRRRNRRSAEFIPLRVPTALGPGNVFTPPNPRTLKRNEFRAPESSRGARIRTYCSAEKQAKIARINRYHVTQFACFLEKLNPNSAVGLSGANGARPSGRFNVRQTCGSRTHKTMRSVKRRKRRAPADCPGNPVGLLRSSG